MGFRIFLSSQAVTGITEFCDIPIPVFALGLRMDHPRNEDNRRNTGKVDFNAERGRPAD
jgi:hypothetical protein